VGVGLEEDEGGDDVEVDAGVGRGKSKGKSGIGGRMESGVVGSVMEGILVLDSVLVSSSMSGSGVCSNSC